MRRDRARLRQHLTALHLFPLDPAQQAADVVARLTLIQQLPEHLHARHRRLARLGNPHDLHLVTHLHDPPLHATRHHRPATRNRKHILDRHQERLVHIPLGNRHELVQRLHQPLDRLRPLLVLHPLHRLERAAADHRRGVARKLVLAQQFPNLQLHQVHQLRIVHHVHLVQVHQNHRHAHLPRQHDVLTRLGHRSVVRPHHQDRAVHLRRTRNHVLDVIGVTRAIHVRVVPVRRRIFHVRGRNRQNLHLVAPTLRNARLGHLIVTDGAG